MVLCLGLLYTYHNKHYSLGLNLLRGDYCEQSSLPCVAAVNSGTRELCLAKYNLRLPFETGVAKEAREF